MEKINYHWIGLAGPLAGLEEEGAGGMDEERRRLRRSGAEEARADLQPQRRAQRLHLRRRQTSSEGRQVSDLTSIVINKGTIYFTSGSYSYLTEKSNFKSCWTWSNSVCKCGTF